MNIISDLRSILESHTKVTGEDGKSYHQWRATSVQLGIAAISVLMTIVSGTLGALLWHNKEVETKVQELERLVRVPASTPNAELLAAIKVLETTNSKLSSDLAAANQRLADLSKNAAIHNEKNGTTQSAPSPRQPSSTSSPADRTSPSNLVANSAPQDLSLGQIAKKVSLLNNATWTVPTSPIARRLRFEFEGSASFVEGVRIGRAQMTLLREGRELCTISLTTAGSPGNNKGVGDSSPSCSDEVQPGQSFTYRAHVTAEGLTPEKVLVKTVVATRL